MREKSTVLRMVDAALADELTALVARASAAILAIAPAAMATRLKADRTPVTAADEAADRAIAQGLARILPGLAIVSEEGRDRAAAAPGATFALVDPLDGTKEFVAGRGEYTVNLAIVTDGEPIAGFIAVPALGVIYRGVAGRGAERLGLDLGEPVAIRCRRAPATGLVAAVSRSHLDPDSETFLARLAVGERIACGSALKFCRIAEGLADVYPRLAPTSEWDTAAGHAIVTAAGGIVTTPAGAPLRYGRAREDFKIAGFVAWGDPTRRVDPVPR